LSPQKNVNSYIITVACIPQKLKLLHRYTVKGARGKVSFDSQTDIYASQLSSDASPEEYWKMKSVFVILEVRCDKYASGEA
jgi:hypothetical protein